MKQWVADIIQQKEVSAIPVMTHPGIEMNGCTVREAVTNGQVHAEAVTALARKYPCAAACTIMDLTVEAEAFGAAVTFSDEAVPAVTGRLLTDAESIHHLQIPTLRAGRIPQYLKANLLAVQALDEFDSTQARPLFSGCIGPFSLAGRLFGLSEMMVLICEQPEAAHELLEKSTGFIGKYCQALKLAGSNGVLMAEPAAGLLSDADCRVFSSQYVQRIVERVQDDSFIVILHNCGNTGQCTQAMVSTGAAAYHFGNKCHMDEVIRDVPPTVLAMGNIDPVSMFKDGTPDEMYQTVTEQLQMMHSFPNYVLSSGCDTPPHTPAANIDAFFRALAHWNSQQLIANSQ